MGDILYRGDCRRDDILYYRILGDEMVKDLIYREDAIKAACKGFCHPGACCPDSGCKELDPIKNLPAAERWIPCSERTPALGFPVVLNEGYAFAVGYLLRTTEGKYEWAVNGWYNDFEDWSAWMPLPEPYKGEHDG